MQDRNLIFWGFRGIDWKLVLAGGSQAGRRVRDTYSISLYLGIH